MIDKQRAMSKINQLEAYLEELKSYIPGSYEDYINSRKTRRLCERLLQISIDCAIDICSVVAKDTHLGPPSDEEDIFEKLKKNKIISVKVAKSMKSMKGFRNILVHRYAEVDDDFVFQFLKNNLSDFMDLMDVAIKFLKKNGKK